MNNYSFWKLINEHRIDIPVIQRDYAQGRKSAETLEIRSEFIRVIVDTLTSDRSGLHLNFIYGKIQGLQDQRKLTQNKNAIMLKAVEDCLNSRPGYAIKEEFFPTDLHRTSFVPLDGQQRLTTLFLLHWYLLKRRKDQASIPTLLNFSYHIRPSTKQFCRELVKNPMEFEAGQAIHERIIDAPWFFLYWRKDPSVKGMLTVLDEIHMRCGGLPSDVIESMWSKLVSGSKKGITFELIDLDGFELTDELYVKMNARGKALTHFENFKAWLMQEISRKKLHIEINQWSGKLDGEWADLFWDNKDEDNMIIDEEYLRFFRNMMQIFYVMSHPVDSKTEEGRKCRDIASNEISPKEDKFISHSSIQGWNVLTQENLDELFLVLDIISSLKVEKRDVYDLMAPVFRGFIAKSVTNDDKIRFYGVSRYLLEFRGKNINKDDIQAFDSVLKKLIDNQEIDDVATIKTICNGLRNNAHMFGDLYKNLASRQLDFPGFRAEQVVEERIKSALFLKNDPEWNQLISDAETFDYFKGQIGFLFHLTKIKACYESDIDLTWDPDIDREMKDAFSKFSEIARTTIFNTAGINVDNGYIVERALLTYGEAGDLLYRDGSKWAFPKNIHRDYSWNRYLRGYSADGKPLLIWNALEKLFLDLKNGRSCAEIVGNYTIDDWRKCFIRYPETIEFCGNNKWFLGAWDGRFLLTKSDRRSDYRELESFCFYKEFLESNPTQLHPFRSDGYKPGNSKDGDPYACLKWDYETDQILLMVFHFHDGYRLKLRNAAGDLPDIVKNKFLEGDSFITSKSDNTLIRSIKDSTIKSAVAEVVKLAKSLMQTTESNG